jgi:HB1/ASXL restriction endonuclease-like protein with HTH domain
MKREGVVNEMAEEKQAPDAYSAVIADLKSRRNEIDKTIAMLEALRHGVGPRSAPPSLIGGASDSTQAHAATEIVETAGAFLGMSIVNAAKKLLAMRKRTMSNPEIARELMAGGLVLTSAEPANVIGSVLSRRFNQVGDVVKVGRGIWGLKEWYPGRNFKQLGKTVTLMSNAETNKPEAFQDDNDPASGPGEPNTGAGVVDMD